MISGGTDQEAGTRGRHGKAELVALGRQRIRQCEQETPGAACKEERLAGGVGASRRADEDVRARAGERGTEPAGSPGAREG